MRTRLPIVVITLFAVFVFAVACGDDPASPPDVPDVPDLPGDDPGLDVASILADYAAGEVEHYADALHAEFRFVTSDVDATPYARAQELDLFVAMHAGDAGTGAVVLQEIELLAIEPVGQWVATDRDDLLGAHRLGARKRAFSLTLRFMMADSVTSWDVSGQVTAFADTLDGSDWLLGLVDQTGDSDRSDAPSWSEVRRAWAAPELPELPGTPDLLSMRWIATHDGRDWLRMGELLHPDFRYVDLDGEVGDRADELATFADLMAGRPGRDDARVAQLDVQDWEKTEGPWVPVGPDDPHFGDVHGAVAQWMDIRIVYTTAGGEPWLVDGMVRMGAVESPRGWQMLGFVDNSADTGEPGSVGWSVVRGHGR